MLEIRQSINVVITSLVKGDYVFVVLICLSIYLFVSNITQNSYEQIAIKFHREGGGWREGAGEGRGRCPGWYNED